MQKILATATMLAMCIGTTAQTKKDTTRVECVRMAGPITMLPVLTTTDKDANDKAYNQEDLLWDMPLSTDMLWETTQGTNLWETTTNADSEKKSGENGTKVWTVQDSCGFVIKDKGLYLLGFTIDNNKYQKVNFIVQAKGRNEFLVDGNRQDGETALTAGRHKCVLKLQQKEDVADTVNIKVVSNTDSLWTAHFSGIKINAEGKRNYTLADHMTGERLHSTSISADGRFVLENTYMTRNNGQTEWSKYIVDLKTGNRYQPLGFVQWAAKGGRYISRHNDRNNQIIYEYRDVLTGETEHLYTHHTQEAITFAANDTKAIIYQTTEGPKEKHQHVRQILEPDDRLPGWRNRSGLSVIDLKTGKRQQITTGMRSTGGTMSSDGKWMYLALHEYDVRERPFYFQTGMLMDMTTGKVDTLFRRDGFVSSAQFSPDAKALLFTGSPEAFGGIGNVCPDNMVPNKYESELFLMDLNTKEVVPLTKDFDPNVQNVKWSVADNNIYALCENKDEMSIFRLNMTKHKDGKCNGWEMMALKEPYVSAGFDLAKEQRIMVYSGMSAETTDHSWVLDMKKNRHISLTDLNPTRLEGIAMGTCRDWSYRTERGDSIKGCYFLPPYFDENRKYPMLVYYYGGVTPVGKVLESSYNYQAWATMGYVVYVLQPSGCTGFGQEFAARHSNAWGDYTADDIIEGTRQFVREHPFVNENKIGCMGASYGGFMTQYLQTRTDIFAAAMSHAGISSQASYWGEGNWGYSYSAAASPDSYPWNNTKLYTEHSPLFNADKVNTPLLFMHGTADNNVPMGESIQMFNALKILGKETAFIMVDGENHYISDYHKRIRWHDSIMAWFQKWLQDDATWWNDMYPEKDL